MRVTTVALAVLMLVGLGECDRSRQPAGAAPAAGLRQQQGKCPTKRRRSMTSTMTPWEGDLVRPDGEMIDSTKRAKHSSLIKIRENFIPRCTRSPSRVFSILCLERNLRTSPANLRSDYPAALQLKLDFCEVPRLKGQVRLSS